MPQDRAKRPEQSSSDGQPPQGGRVVPPPANSSPQLPESIGSSKGTYFLGRYRVVDEIGIGGMASVHLARMDGPGGFQKWVAIKRIHPHLIEDDSFIHMFLDEARIAARISHPNVATVFELGKHDDTYWIAMEYLHGEPLREVMRRTEETGAPMPPEIACRVIADAAEGLHAAHELLGKNGEKLNLIHRDVTPHNLFVTYDGNTKVVDFGIAKFSSRMSSTRAGTLKGKLAYMSPEQVQGETIDRRTDIFALGVVLWELTTGQRLFRMDSDLDTLAKVQECNIPRPSTIIRGYPIDLEKIVMKALAKNRGERFKTAREFSRMLQSLLMRRGLFIASDEVANYVQTIFKERIEKREAHLRWAGEVTQTINLDQLQGGGDAPTIRGPSPASATAGAPYAEVSLHTNHSDVQAAAVSSRPAPRPAAGMPAAPPPAAPPVSRQSARLAAPPLKAPLPQPPRSAPADDEMDDDDDAPTLQATVAQVMAARGPGSAPTAAIPYAGGAGFDEDFDDNNDTIVEQVPEGGFARPRPGYAPLPAAGRPAPSTRGGPTSSGPRTLPINTMSPTSPRGPYAPPPGPASRTAGAGPAPTPPPFQISDPSLPHTPYGAEFGAPLPMPPQPAESELFPPRPPAVTMPRLFAPPPGDAAGQTAQIPRGNRAPWWAVSILAATAVFMVTGVIFLIVSLVSGPSTRVAQGGAASSATGATPPAAAPAPAPAPSPGPTAPAGSAGPFVSARNGFLASLAARPSSASSPAPSPSGRPGDPPIDRAGPPAAPSATAAGPETPAPTPQPTAAEPAATTAPVATAPAPTPQPTPPAPSPSPPVATATTPIRRGGASSASVGASTGLLSVICIPGCDQIYDNGRLLGPSPIFKRPATLGSHRIKLVSSNPPATKTISTIVVADQVAMVRESMP